jgi:methyl-accepting chemotaxis protein
VETVTETLSERVDRLVEASKERLLSTTPTSVAIHQLAARTEALENALREIALEVQELSAHREAASAGGSARILSAGRSGS